MSSVPAVLIDSQSKSEFEWVEIKAPSNAVMKSGNARIVSAIARLRSATNDSATVSDDLKRESSVDDQAFARYAADRWDD